MTETNAAAILQCPLCQSTQTTVRHSLRADEILKCWALDGGDFSDEVKRPLREEGTIHLYECAICGFQFFNPKLAGGGQFYQEVKMRRPDYYASNRPEGERNARFAVSRGYRNLLDIGCGSGASLDVAKRFGLETFGIELSSTAAAEAAARGHRVFPVLLEQMDPQWEGKFDLISLNQVLEHVGDPVDLIRQCQRFLSPRGAIAIAVPGAGGILKFAPWMDANWPPHHVSRWRLKDFERLAQRTGLTVVQSGGDPLLGSVIEAILSGHRNDCAVLQKPGGLPRSLIRLIAFVYRKTGLKFLFRSQGQSIYCFLQRPGVMKSR